MPALERPTVALHYEDVGIQRGELPVLVFLHGWCDGSPSWADTIAEFASEYRCLAPDMRGHNRSGRPRDGCYSAEALSNDVVALCRATEVARPILVGHSFGGYLAAETVRRFPGFARAVVVVDQGLDLREFGAQMRAMEPLIRGAETHLAFRTQLYDSMMSALMPDEGRALLGKMKAQTPVEVGLGLWAPLFEFTPEEMAERSDQLMKALSHQPSLSIDHAAELDYQATLASHAPDVKSLVIESGHWIHLERPADFRSALRTFLSQI